MSKCEDCIHSVVCFKRSMKEGLELQEFELECHRFVSKDVVEVVRCEDCKYSRSIDKSKSPEKYFKKDCIVCQCEEVVGDEPMIYRPNHFCSYGERKDS